MQETNAYNIVNISLNAHNTTVMENAIPCLAELIPKSQCQGEIQLEACFIQIVK